MPGRALAIGHGLKKTLGIPGQQLVTFEQAVAHKGDMLNRRLEALMGLIVDQDQF